MITVLLETQGCGKEFFPVEYTIYLLNTEVMAPIPTILHHIVLVIPSIQGPWILYAVVEFHIHFASEGL